MFTFKLFVTNFKIVETKPKILWELSSILVLCHILKLLKWLLNWEYKIIELLSFNCNAPNCSLWADKIKETVSFWSNQQYLYSYVLHFSKKNQNLNFDFLELLKLNILICTFESCSENNFEVATKRKSFDVFEFY